MEILLFSLEQKDGNTAMSDSGHDWVGFIDGWGPVRTCFALPVVLVSCFSVENLNRFEN